LKRESDVRGTLEDVLSRWTSKGVVDVAGLIRNMSYEIMPLGDIEAAVRRFVPREVLLNITAAESRGLDPTVHLAVSLARDGYRVAPHLAARLIKDEAHLRQVAGLLDEAEIRSVFVVGGDAREPVGEFEHAQQLIEALDHIGFVHEDLGVAGYPEGHSTIPDELLHKSLLSKAVCADRIITQICFDPDVTVNWASRLVQSGIEVPVFVGVPGPVSRQRLMRISASIGIGQSARFLQKQQNLFWRLLLPGVYNPDRLVRRLASAISRDNGSITGLHVFTFNELERSERWRQRFLAPCRIDGEGDDDSLPVG